jgi:hypothetical protein
MQSPVEAKAAPLREVALRQSAGLHDFMLCEAIDDIQHIESFSLSYFLLLVLRNAKVNVADHFAFCVNKCQVEIF